MKPESDKYVPEPKPLRPTVGELLTKLGFDRNDRDYDHDEAVRWGLIRALMLDQMDEAVRDRDEAMELARAHYKEKEAAYARGLDAGMLLIPAIENDNQHAEAIKVIERLMNDDLSDDPAQSNRLKALAVLVDEYERRRWPMSENDE